MSDKELAAFRNKQLGFVFQSFHLINSLNVLDNVGFPCSIARYPPRSAASWPRPC